MMWNVCVLFAIFSAVAMRATAASDELPIIDLGYVRQRATTYDDSLDIYTFSNIRYARSPTKDLRWKAPEAPLPEKHIQDGTEDRLCFQAQSLWQIDILGPWLGAVATNRTDEFYAQFPSEPSPPTNSSFPPLLPEETEDCLFLDVYISSRVLQKRTDRPAAVMVWIHGGGLSLGNKKADGNFSAFVAESMRPGNEPVVVVSTNYRLGAFGFLGGPMLRSAGGVSNTGLLDQKFALQWVHDHIGKFGGNAAEITAAGESAGGASIIHHIVSNGGRGPAPVFQRALIQSGGWNPTKSTRHLDLMYRRFTRALNVSDLKSARQKSALDIRNANFQLTYGARWGSLVFGVEADGVLIPEPAPVLLASGRFHRGISVMTGQNGAEGVIFASPWTRNRIETQTYLIRALPDAPQDEISHINEKVYPLPGPGHVQDQAAYVARAQEMVAEAGVLCNSAFLSHACGLNNYNYVFDVPPAWHATDLPYTFYDGSDPSVDAKVAKAMQKHFLSFIFSGHPSTRDQSGPTWERYGPSAFTAEFTPALTNPDSDFNVIRNPGENDRCLNWWRRGFYSWKSPVRGATERKQL